MPPVGTPFRRSAACWWASAAVLLPMSATPSTPARRELEAQYAMIQRAYRGRNPYAVFQLMTPDYTWKRVGMPILSRRGAQQTLHEWLGRLRAVKGVAARIERVSVSGGSALVLRTATLAAVVADQAGRAHDLVSTETSRDSWVKTRAGWRLRHTETLRSSASVDGHPVEGQTAPARR